MKGNVRLKSITFFFIVAGVNCNDSLDEIKVSLDKLQDTLDKGSPKKTAHFEDIVLIRETIHPSSLIRTFGLFQPYPSTP